jgi:hypothetical protein
LRLATSGITLLKRVNARGDNLQAQYLLGANEQLVAAHAARTGQRQRAEDLYRSALAHLEPVAAAVTLDALDMVSVEEARAGLRRVENLK